MEKLLIIYFRTISVNIYGRNFPEKFSGPAIAATNDSAQQHDHLSGNNQAPQKAVSNRFFR